MWMWEYPQVPEETGKSWESLLRKTLDTGIWTRYPPNTNVEHYHYSSLLVGSWEHTTKTDSKVTALLLICSHRRVSPSIRDLSSDRSQYMWWSLARTKKLWSRATRLWILCKVGAPAQERWSALHCWNKTHYYMDRNCILKWYKNGE